MPYAENQARCCPPTRAVAREILPSCRSSIAKHIFELEAAIGELLYDRPSQR